MNNLRNRGKLNYKRILISIIAVIAVFTINIGYSYIETITSLLGSFTTTDNLNNCYGVEILGKKVNACLDNKKSKYVSSATGINFSSANSNTNGKGLYIMSSTKDDTNPIYYYRGDIDNNNLIFGGKCWKIVRTTETGGTKLLYNGEVSVTDTDPLEKTQYVIKTNTTTYPYIFDDSMKKWRSSNHSSSTTSTMEFNVSQTGEYYLSYIISSEKNYDKATFYVDNVKKKEVSGSEAATISLGTLTSSNVIKVTYSKDSSVNKDDDNITFSIDTSLAETKSVCNNIGSRSLKIGGEKYEFLKK